MFKSLSTSLELLRQCLSTFGRWIHAAKPKHTDSQFKVRLHWSYIYRSLFGEWQVTNWWFIAKKDKDLFISLYTSTINSANNAQRHHLDKKTLIHF